MLSLTGEDLGFADRLQRIVGSIPTTQFLVVTIGSDDCLPCVYLRPHIRKLAFELQNWMSLLELDGTKAHDWVRAFDIKAYPELLFFQGGALIERLTGFPGGPDLRRLVLKTLEITEQRPPSAEDLAFALAEEKARLAFDESLKALRENSDCDFEAVRRQALPIFEQAMMQAVEAFTKSHRARPAMQIRAPGMMCLPGQDYCYVSKR